MFWLIGGVMAAVVTVLFVRGTRGSDRLASQPTTTGILRPPHIFSTGQFFPVTLVRENVLAPELLTNSQTFYSPTLVVSAGLIAPLLSNANTFYAPQLNQNISASLFTNTESVFAPIVARVDGLAASLFTNTQTFYGPTLHHKVSPALFSNSTVFYATSVILGASPGYALSSPGVTVTSAAGEAPEIDLTINADHYSGYYLDIQRSTTGAKNASDNSYVSTTMNISHLISPSEIGALAITNTDLAQDGYFDPSGTYFQQYRIRREDGALSPWVEISGTITTSTARWATTTGANKSQYVTTADGLAAYSNSNQGTYCGIRSAVEQANAKCHFELTIDDLCSSSGRVTAGITNATQNLQTTTGLPGSGSLPGCAASMAIGSTSCSVGRNGGSQTVTLAAVPVAGDAICVEPDRAANRVSFYHYRAATGTASLIATVTMSSNIPANWYAFGSVHRRFASDNLDAFTANFGASAYLMTPSTGFNFPFA
jgi:hypothetical protein